MDTDITISHDNFPFLVGIQNDRRDRRGWLDHLGGKDGGFTMGICLLPFCFSFVEVRKKCVAQINVTSCVLVSAIGEYPVLVDSNGSITIADTHMLKSPKIVRLANNTALNGTVVAEQHLDKNEWPRTTLGGISDAIQLKWYTDVGALPMNPSSGGPPIAFWTRGESLWSLGNRQVTTDGCVPSWSDPRDEVCNTLQSLPSGHEQAGYVASAAASRMWVQIHSEYLLILVRRGI